MTLLRFIMMSTRSRFRLQPGDLVSVRRRTRAPSKVGRRGQRAIGIVMDWADSSQYQSACALVMVEGEQAWYDYRDMQRLNDRPEDRPSARMLVNE